MHAAFIALIPACVVYNTVERMNKSGRIYIFFPWLGNPTEASVDYLTAEKNPTEASVDYLGI
jgi:hypothetical protein